MNIEMDIQNEQRLIQIIAYSGNAKSLCMEAMQDAFSGEFEAASENMRKAKESLAEAHESHTQMLTASACGEEELISPILIHAQDHFMGASLTMDLIELMIQMQNEIMELKGGKKNG